MKHPSEFIPCPFTDRLCDLHCPMSSVFIPRSESRLLVPFIPCRNVIDRARLRWNYDLKAAFLTSVTALCGSVYSMGRGAQCLPSHSGRGPYALSSCSVLPCHSDHPPTPMSISTFQGHLVKPLKEPQLIWVPLQQFFLFLYNQWYFCALVWAPRNSKFKVYWSFSLGACESSPWYSVCWLLQRSGQHSAGCDGQLSKCKAFRPDRVFISTSLHFLMYLCVYIILHNSWINGMA